MAEVPADIDQLSVATIRTLSIDVVQKANSGHPGAPMGMAPAAHVLFNKHMRMNPNNAKWINRDRFVLSNGHASALLYTLLHLSGYPQWSMDVLKTFRQLNSIAAGHPESHFPGIEVTTGPLGQGLSNGVGLAMAESHLAARYNKPDFTLFDNYTYVFCGDGCLQEGITSEASSLAGHLGLGKLIVIYDDNKITIDGNTDLSFTENVNQRYESYGWHTITVTDGDTNLSAIDEAIKAAKSVKDKPTLIKLTTTIAYGSAKQGTSSVHGSPLGAADVASVKTRFGFNPEQSFHVPPQVYEHFSHKEKGQKLEDEWNALFAKYKAQYPELGQELERKIKGELPTGWEEKLKSAFSFKPGDAAVATRTISGNVLNVAAAQIHELFGGSADLNPSCFTYLKTDKDYQKGSFEHRNVRFGVREHAMAAIMNGLASYGGFIPFCSTFLNFIGYAYGAVILSSLSELRVLYVFTHDSIFLGEDGPTHQPIEKYATCRATPNLNFIRPADGNETVAAYIAAIKATKTPTVMSLSRQNLPQVEGSSVDGALKGGYVVSDCEGKPDVILVGTGSELHLCTGAKAKLSGLKVRVVSFPCWELFDAQSSEYKQSVLTPGVPALSVEAASTSGWSRFTHGHVGIDTFGASGTQNDLAKHYGMTVDNVVDKAQKLVKFYEGKVPEARYLQPF
eukprot:TRINITY_DN8778_c0_g1_i1.p1 TRINITY_DN8778_c0_g1~~TRINITY_DN8778_c0_g1_i1.p1  ORF type:complete len:713 (-),score=182.52 TRINITY_DN8778_c0_g1_i1:58-2091(-)